MAGRHRKEQLGERIGIPIEIIGFDQYRMATKRLGDPLPCSVQGVSNFFHTFAVFMQEPDSNVPGKQNLSPSLVGAELLMLDACCGMHGEKDGIHVAFGNGFHEKNCSLCVMQRAWLYARTLAVYRRNRQQSHCRLFVVGRC